MEAVVLAPEPVRFCFFALLSLIIFFILPGSPVIKPAAAEQELLNALYLLDPPSDYDAFERVVKSYIGTGADTIIIRPVSHGGLLNRKILAKAVFFSHASGMKLFVLLPTRGMTSILQQYPEWHDAQYSLQTGNREPVDRLDLFNPYVVVAVTDFFRDVAGYCVDGIILDDDFFYGDREGMSDNALARYKQTYGSAFPIRKSMARINGSLPQDHGVDAYGDAFWNLAELKKARLLLLIQNIVQAARSVNQSVRFGIALHVPGLFVKEKELLAWYSHDLNAFRKMDISFFWLAIPHRELRVRQESNYEKSIETVARLGVSSLALVNDPSMMVIAVQTVTDEGRVLPLTEIEEVSTQVQRGGPTGIAFMVGAEAQLPPELTRKIFKKRTE